MAVNIVLRCTMAAAFLASATAFQAPAFALRGHHRAAVATVRTVHPTAPGLRSRRVVPVMMAGTTTLTRDVAKQEEERRIKLWKDKFALSNDQVQALRSSFEEVLKANPSDTNTLPTQKMKTVIEKTQVMVDAVDVGNDGRPQVTQEELQNYIDALPPLWGETCEADAIEVANGECQIPLDLENFDLSETLAIFGMCLKEHCGIGGVCFWDTPSTPSGGKW